MSKKVYIAGKVSGLPIAETTMKFGSAQKKLEAQGYEVVNPLAVVCEQGDGWRTDWQTAMKLCIRALMDCNYIYLLPCWKDSLGARIEKKIAGITNIEILNKEDGK
jgi:hypothetical protein